MQYQDFEIEISRNADGNYLANANSPQQGEASQAFSLPNAITLENYILKMRGFSRSLRTANSPEVQAAIGFGELLFENAFGGEISPLLKSCLDQTSHELGLRIKLILQDVPELSALPWEFLYLPRKQDFLAHSPATPIVRYLKYANLIKPLTVVLPLKLLVVIASPNDLHLLDTAKERRELQKAVAQLEEDGLLQITWIEHATVVKIAEVLEENTFHLLHYIGHSYFDNKHGEGALVLENEFGQSDYYEAARLKVLLHDHHSLRLVLLNSCEGAKQDTNDPFSSIATTLMLAGIPAVIAMQFEISDQAAITFSKIFYKWLAKGAAIDRAVGEARKYLFAVEKNNVEWGTPVLYLRSKNGELFNIASQEEQQRLKLEGLAQKQLLQEKIESEKIAHQKELEIQLAQEKAVQKQLKWQSRIARLKKWGKYLAGMFLIGFCMIAVYVLLEKLTVAYKDYKKQQEVIVKETADKKVKEEQLIVLAKQKEAMRLKLEVDAKAEIAKQETLAKQKDEWQNIDRYQVKDGLVKDTVTGLMWMRCSLGQNWNGSTCQGDAKRYNWNDAMKQNGFNYASYSDWRVPTREELKTLVFCSSGLPKTWNDTFNEKKYDGCDGKYTRPTIKTEVFLNTPSGIYWSSSENSSDDAWFQGFSNGNQYSDYKYSPFYVRAVRAF